MAGSSGFLFAQQECKVTITVRDVPLVFRPGETHHEHGNAMLIRLAAYRDRSPYRLPVFFTLRETMEIRDRVMQSPLILVRMEYVGTTGELDYRGFSLDSLMAFSFLGCRLDLIELPDSTLMRSYPLGPFSTSVWREGITTTEIPLTREGKWSVAVSDIRCLPGPDDLSRFLARMELINDYYASAALIDSLLNRTADWNPLVRHDLPDKYLIIIEIGKIIHILQEKGFPALLNLEESDPAGYLPKFRNLNRFYRSAAMTFSDQLATDSVIPWDGDPDRLAQRYIDRLEWYISKSMLLNGIRGGIYQHYLTGWFSLPGLEREMWCFSTLTRLMFAGRHPADIHETIVRKVWLAYDQKAAQMIGENRHAEAMKLLDHRDAWCEVDPVAAAVEDEWKLKQQAAAGVFGSFLVIAESCMDQQKADMARMYLDKAMEYQRVNPGIIVQDTLFQRIFRKLFSYRLRTCDALLSDHKYQEAIECYTVFECGFPADMVVFLSGHLDEKRREAWQHLFYAALREMNRWLNQQEEELAVEAYGKAVSIQKWIPGDTMVLLALQELHARMLPVRYQYLESRGTRAYYAYSMEEAYATFSEAMELAKEGGLSPDSTVIRMFQESYKHHLLNEISLATGMIWNDQFEEAREYAHKMESVMDLYHTDIDPDLQKAVEGFRRKIEWKICMNRLEEVRVLTARATRNLEMKRFDLAVRQLGEARNLATGSPGCDIPFQSLSDTIQKYLPAAFYQEKLEEIRREAVLGTQETVIRLITDNERFYHHQSLSQLGVPLVSLREFLGEIRRVSLTKAGVTHFLRIGDPDAAWNCLCLLMTDGIEARDVRELQEQTGEALAIRDFGIDQDSSPVENVKAYTAGNRWFAIFAKAYVSRWKTLQKP